MRRFLRENSLSLAFTALLLGALVGRALTGQAGYNETARDAGLPTLGLGWPAIAETAGSWRGLGACVLGACWESEEPVDLLLGEPSGGG